MEFGALNTEFGHLLEYLLEIKGWKAARLAKELNVDQSYIRKWVRDLFDSDNH